MGKSVLTAKKTSIKLPIFLPDATLGVVKGLDSTDLLNVNIKGVVVNTFHLMSSPGINILTQFNGVKNVMNFDGLVVSDSGGWQVFSLIRRHNLPGKITDEGVLFTFAKSNTLFTPELSIKTQFDIQSDIIICLDDFVPKNASNNKNKEIVQRTINWAKRSKKEYTKQIKERNLKKEQIPMIFSVIQGGYDKELRKRCANELIDIGFDGYGFGGYVVNDDGQLDLDISKYIADLIPNNSYKFALGVGRPSDIRNLFSMGWEIFDCTLPTRDARHKRLYTHNNKKNYINIGNSSYKLDDSPIEQNCDCLTCKNYSKAYLHHLFKIKDTSAYRLATIHNLRFYTRLIESLM